MDRVLLVVCGITIVGYAALMVTRPNAAAEGLNFSAEMFLQSMPWIIVSVFLAGLLAQFFHPQELGHWFGPEAGWRGVCLAAILGIFGTGSRWAVYPLAAALLGARATPGASFAFLTSWQLVSLARLPAEVPFFGIRFTLVKSLLSVGLAVIGGLLLNVFTKHIDL